MTLHKMRLLFLTFFVLLCTCSALGEGEVILEDDPASEEEVTLIEEEFETPDLQLGDTGDGVSQLPTAADQSCITIREITVGTLAKVPKRR